MVAASGEGHTSFRPGRQHPRRLPGFRPPRQERAAMHPILFHIPLPNFNLPYAWIPFIVAAIAALVAVAKMVGKEKDRQGAIAAVVVAVAAVAVRFTLMRGNVESWAVGQIPI